MDTELKPCPFCGNVPSTMKWRGAPAIGVGCTWCEVAPGVSDEGGPCANSADWNTRPIEDALRAELAALRAKWEGVPWHDIIFIVSRVNLSHSQSLVTEWLVRNGRANYVIPDKE